MSDPTKEDMRAKTLRLAKLAVLSDRNVDYGEPEDNFKLIAEYWTTYTGMTFLPTDVAVMFILTKIARAEASPHVLDHWVDIAGYAACAAKTGVPES